MKIALLVFPIHYSHGCILQTYALYSFLQRDGHDVTILDRQPAKQPVHRWGVTVVKRCLRRLIKGYKGAVFYRGWFPTQIMTAQKRFLDGFRKDIITVYSTEELRIRVLEGAFDAVVVGSDQTWRPRNVANVMDYWLDFASDIAIKKIAYAPSFGVDVWEYSNEQTKRCKQLANLFQGISVREKSGVVLCKENLGKDVCHVLDPTMLWDKEFYSPVAKKASWKEGGCQCYFLDTVPEKTAIANQVAAFLNLDVNYINTRTEDGSAPIKERIAPSIEKWLAGFLYGDFIVVDSFHAMVFSIIFEKPFVVIGNYKRGLSRFESLLDELGLKRRLLTDTSNLYEVVTEPINWRMVKSNLLKHRDSSISFLREALNKE